MFATPHTDLVTGNVDGFGALVSGASDTLSATLAALLASGTDLEAATRDGLAFLDQCLNSGYRPGMGQILPDRLFWAEIEDGPQAAPRGDARLPTA